jgi:hypothetical protein
VSHDGALAFGIHDGLTAQDGTCCLVAVHCSASGG